MKNGYAAVSWLFGLATVLAFCLFGIGLVTQSTFAVYALLCFGPLFWACLWATYDSGGRNAEGVMGDLETLKIGRRYVIFDRFTSKTKMTTLVRLVINDRYRLFQFSCSGELLPSDATDVRVIIKDGLVKLRPVRVTRARFEPEKEEECEGCA